MYTEVKIFWKSLLIPKTEPNEDHYFKKEKMKLLAKEQQESNENSKICNISNEELENKYLEDKKVGDHCHYTEEYRGAAQSICNLKYCVPKKVLISFHNGVNYDYHFIQKSWLGENTKKYITLTFTIEKEATRIDKNGKELTKNISYILQLINGARIMAGSLSNLVNIELHVNTDTMMKMWDLWS